MCGAPVLERRRAVVSLWKSADPRVLVYVVRGSNPPRRNNPAASAFGFYLTLSAGGRKAIGLRSRHLGRRRRAGHSPAYDTLSVVGFLIIIAIGFYVAAYTETRSASIHIARSSFCFHVWPNQRTEELARELIDALIGDGQALL